ncbi:MAG: hypothetical protein AAB263_18730, partial [Planctomycetota bacterium]
VLPKAAQQNLGITWATAEYRIVQGVVRMPGRFEAESTARRAYRAPLAGRIELLVKPYQRVAAGTVLYRLYAADWQRLQQALADATAAVIAAAEQHAAAVEHVAALDGAVSLWSARLATLDKLGQELGGKAAERAEVAGRVAELRISLAEAKRELAAAARQAFGADGHAECGQARMRLHLLLAQAAQLTALPEAELAASDSHGIPAWAAITALEFRAAFAGVVEGEVQASGGWADANAHVLTVIDPTGVRLRAAGLQADLPRLRDGMTARIVAADPAVTQSIAASLVIGPVADAIDRSVELIAHPVAGGTIPVWVRPGVTANLEVVLSGTADEELAIPVAATIRDGLKTIYFRRDQKHPDRVTKDEADLGASDGRWVVVQSNLKEGDQVVLGGIYPLKLSQQESGAQTGHFEADGTFHTGKH